MNRGRSRISTKSSIDSTDPDRWRSGGRARSRNFRSSHQARSRADGYQSAGDQRNRSDPPDLPAGPEDCGPHAIDARRGPIHRAKPCGGCAGIPIQGCGCEGSDRRGLRSRTRRVLRARFQPSGKPSRPSWHTRSICTTDDLSRLRRARESRNNGTSIPTESRSGPGMGGSLAGRKEEEPWHDVEDKAWSSSKHCPPTGRGG